MSYVRLVYIKRWRTIVPLPEKYVEEIVEALRQSSTEASEDDIAAVIVAAQTSNSSICAAALQQKFKIVPRTAVPPARAEQDAGYGDLQSDDEKIDYAESVLSKDRP